MPRTPKGDPPKSKMIWARVTEEFHEAVTKAAAAEERTLSSFVERAVGVALRASRPTPRRKA